MQNEVIMRLWTVILFHLWRRRDKVNLFSKIAWIYWVLLFFLFLQIISCWSDIVLVYQMLLI